VTTGGIPDESQWDAVPGVWLADVVTGEPPRQVTRVHSCYDVQAGMWFVKFDAEDDAIVSDFMNHDDPLYDQDVFEMFYSDTPDPYRYKELEVSPRNVRFDADITFSELWKFSARLEWNLTGWETDTKYDPARGRLVSVWSIPLTSLECVPESGYAMPINFFRIDRSPAGDEYQAWSPTGVVLFHVPDKFGRILFE